MSAENKKSLTHLSKYLTNDHLDEALTKWFGKIVNFTHWEYVGETGKGDSYLSELIRIKLFSQDTSNNEHIVQVILKSIPKSLSQRLTFRSDEFFKNEIHYYQKVLPVLLEFQSKKNVTDPFDNYTKLVTCYTDGENDFLILEDVTLQNYGSAVRQKGIDIDHCKITLKTFAKFHALSFALKDQNPVKFEEISKEIFETYYAEKNREWYSRFWERLSSVAVDAVSKEYPNTIYEKKIKQFKACDVFGRLVEAATRSKVTGVISHGDSWTNNFLYQYSEDGRPVNAKMIDFQLTRCASPVLDISFFYYACTSQDVREQHYDEFQKFYYDTLAKQISDLGTDPGTVYPWELFLEETKKYSFFGLAFSFESTPFIVLDPEDAFDMNMEGDEKKNVADIWPVKPFKTKEGRLREANNVLHAVDRGYI